MHIIHLDRKTDHNNGSNTAMYIDLVYITVAHYISPKDSVIIYFLLIY